MIGLLNLHSHYSLLKGVSKLDEIIKYAKEQGHDAIALTDSSNVYGAIFFYKQCIKEGIKPIIGTTIDIQNPGKEKAKLVLLAKNKEGYSNILKAITLVNFSESKDISLDTLKDISKGVIAIIPPLNGDILVKGEDCIKTYKEIFKDIYIGISNQDHTPIDGTKTENKTEEYIKLSKKYKVKTIPLPLSYYPTKEKETIFKLLLKIGGDHTSPFVGDRYNDMYMQSSDEIRGWADEDSLKNLSELIESIDFDFEFGEWIFPITPGVEKNQEETTLRDLVEQGLEVRNLKKTKEVEERINYELGVIKDKGYIDYFLTTKNIVDYMHNNDILTTTRGSSAGSLVSYLLKITNVNPLEFNLPFERFLNPFRPSAPDIDIDIADNRRDDVIKYISETFGKDKVAQISTFGTMMARGAVRDTARGLGYSYGIGDRISKLIPLGKQGFPMYIDLALTQVKELKELYDKDEDVKTIIDTAKQIEGNARHISVHAAGVVISPKTLTEYTALQEDYKHGKAITQYEMNQLEDLGLLKFDILGITNLSILHDAIKNIKETQGIDIDLDKIPWDDKKTFKMFAAGQTVGVFQLGGGGMISVLKKMKPERLYDIAVVIALFRPGPMKNIDLYIERKNNPNGVKYMHKGMEKYLKDSYGVLVFQDDLLFTAIELAGYNWEEVDVFRKAVGKKIPELMKEQEALFQEKMIKHSKVSKAVAKQIWELFDPFKGYGFNKAHAMSYAQVSYQTAYMKANYPAEYLAAHLTFVQGDLESVEELIYEAKRMGLKILPPDINKSLKSFSVQDGAIRIGLHGIKNVGGNVVESIIEERSKGEFVDFQDFIVRMSKDGLTNRRSLEAMIKVGVFDSFEERNKLLFNLDIVVECFKERKKEPEQQNTLFGASTPNDITIDLKDTKPSSYLQNLYWEKEYLGVFTTGHPLTNFRKSRDTIREIKEMNIGETVSVVGVIETMKKFINKSGEKMYFITIGDDDNEKIECVCSPRQTAEHEEILVLNKPAKINGKISKREGYDSSIDIDMIDIPKLLS